MKKGFTETELCLSSGASMTTGASQESPTVGTRPQFGEGRADRRLQIDNNQIFMEFMELLKAALFVPLIHILKLDVFMPTAKK